MNTNPYESPNSIKPNKPQPNEPNEPKPSGGIPIDSPELFRVLVRAIGLYLIVIGIVEVIHGLLIAAAQARVTDPWAYGRGAVSYMAPGIILFFFSEKIVRIAYSERPSRQPEELEDEDDQT
jgi:hypothetical protein